MKLIRFAPSVHGVKMLVHDILRLPERSKILFVFKSFINEKMNLILVVTANDLNGGTMYEPLKITKVNKDGFQDYIKSVWKLGGQN